MFFPLVDTYLIRAAGLTAPDFAVLYYQVVGAAVRGCNRYLRILAEIQCFHYGSVHRHLGNGCRCAADIVADAKGGRCQQ